MIYRSAFCCFISILSFLNYGASSSSSSSSINPTPDANTESDNLSFGHSILAKTLSEAFKEKNITPISSSIDLLHRAFFATEKAKRYIKKTLEEPSYNHPENPVSRSLMCDIIYGTLHGWIIYTPEGNAKEKEEKSSKELASKTHVFRHEIPKNKQLYTNAETYSLAKKYMEKHNIEKPIEDVTSLWDSIFKSEEDPDSVAIYREVFVKLGVVTVADILQMD